MHPLKFADFVLFLSTLSLRRATPAKSESLTTYLISIHALLAESDANWFDLWGWTEYFYPRSPCGERRYSLRHSAQSRHFYPRSPCGERPVQIVIIVVHALFLSTLSLRRATGYGQYCIRAREISIHALLAESDISDAPSSAPYAISIHALLAESDLHPKAGKSQSSNFYPRSPCGERRKPKDLKSRR